MKNYEFSLIACKRILIIKRVKFDSLAAQTQIFMITAILVYNLDVHTCDTSRIMRDPPYRNENVAGLELQYCCSRAAIKF